MSISDRLVRRREISQFVKSIFHFCNLLLDELELIEFSAINGSLELQQYERGLSLISFIAQVAPLLGLLGTVFGMVEMFYGLQKAGLANVDAAALSSGIWKALLTTAAGLIVAAGRRPSEPHSRPE